MARVGKRVRGRLYERLVDGGVLRAEDPASVGLSKKVLNANATRIPEGEWAA